MIYHPYLAAPTVWKKKQQRDEKHKATRDNSDLSTWVEVTLYRQASHCKEQCRVKAKSIKRDFKENSGVTESMFTGNISLACRVVQSQHKTGYLRTWELVSVLKARWWDQVETAKGSGREDGREEDGSAQGTAQAMERDTVLLHFSKPSLCANSNSLRHFLPRYPTETAIYGPNIFKTSVFLFLWGFEYSPLRASLLYFELHKADCLPLWFQTYLKHLNK